jgi:hypothetical protein
VAIYSICGDVRCGLRTLDVETGRDRPVHGVSSPRGEEHAPSIWGRRVAFSRTVSRQRVTTPGLIHETHRCDVAYVKTLGSARPSLRLRRSTRRCMYITAGSIALRGTRVAVREGWDTENNSCEGNHLRVLRLYPVNGGHSRVMSEAGVCGQGSIEYGQPVLDARSLYSVYVQPDLPSFMRFDLATGRLTTAEVSPVDEQLAGGFARIGPSSWLYEVGDIEQPTSELRLRTRSPFAKASTPR